MTTLPTPYTPLDVLVARARLNLSVMYEPDDPDTPWSLCYYGPNLFEWFGDYETAEECKTVYIRQRNELLAAYLPPAPERGQITDQVV